MNNYEVYVCKYNDDVLYVGQGKLGRNTHCKSGCSHVYGLNRLHFGGVDFSVEIVSYYETQKDALAEEAKLILSLKPKFNKVGTEENSHYKLYNLVYLNGECNLDIKRFSNTEHDFDDAITYDLQNFTLMECADKLYFNKTSKGYVVDVERNKASSSCYSNYLVDYGDMLFYSKSEVTTFCYKVLFFSDCFLKNERWRKEKAGEYETLSLLTDLLCVIEYV